MSQVHDEIVLAALSVQTESIRKAFNPYIEDFTASSNYPDREAAIRKDKPGDAHFLYPPPPKTAWQRRLDKISRTERFWTWCGQPPLYEVYLCRHYLRHAVKSLRAGDIKSAVKYCGVYSHVIADIIEPGHAVFDWVLDIFTPANVYSESAQIFTNKECLRGPVGIDGYAPRLLGDNFERAEMAAMNDLLSGSRFGAAMATPMEQAIYENRIDDAIEYFSRAQNESAKKVADFIHTVFRLAAPGKKEDGGSCDLCALPYILADVSCLCRFRPLTDVFLDPANFANPGHNPFLLKTRRLALRLETGSKREYVHGLCVIPPNLSESANVQYLLTPGAYRRFSARVGLNPELENLRFLTATFSVRGDGRELAANTVRADALPARIDVELGRTRFLSLEMKFNSMSDSEKMQLRGLTSALHGVWGEPALH